MNIFLKLIGNNRNWTQGSKNETLYLAKNINFIEVMFSALKILSKDILIFSLLERHRRRRFCEVILMS